MGGQIQPQLVNGEVQCHQLQQRAVHLREAGAQLLVKRQIQAGEQGALPQRLLIVVADGILALHRHIGECQRSAGRKLAGTVTAGRLRFGACRLHRSLCIQEKFLLFRR